MMQKGNMLRVTCFVRYAACPRYVSIREGHNKQNVLIWMA